MQAAAQQPRQQTAGLKLHMASPANPPAEGISDRLNTLLRLYHRQWLGAAGWRQQGTAAQGLGKSHFATNRELQIQQQHNLSVT